MKKKIFAAMLCLSMALALLPVTALAANASSVTIGGIALTAATPYYHNGARGGQGMVDNVAAGYNAYFDAATATLTLNGLQVITREYNAVTVNGDVTLVLNGTNTAETFNGDESRGLYCDGALTVKGTGELNATGGAAANTGGSSGVYVQGDLTVSDGTLNATGGVAGTNNSSIGAFVQGSITVSGGTLNATGGMAADGGSVGAFAKTGVTVSGGTLTATGGEAEFNSSYGLYSMAAVTVSDGIFNAVGGTIRMNGGSFGAYAETGFTISGGTATAKGNTRALYAAAVLVGVDAVASTDVSGNTGLAAYASDDANNDSYRYFRSLTPVAVPTFAPAAGDYTGAQRVTISCATEGAIIRYTTDGSEPTDSSEAYTGAIEVSATATIKAKAFKDGMSDSKTASAAYTITPAVTVYRITKGENGKWTKGGAAGLGFTADADYERFTAVSVDGREISTDQYAAQAGSTVVTLKSTYLETLTAGEHTLRLTFEDGYAETTFTVAAPATGDASAIAFWLGAAILASAGLAACVVRRRRLTGR